MKQTAKQIADRVQGTLTGRDDVVLESVASLKNAGPAELVYAEDKFMNEARQSRAGCIIIPAASKSAADALKQDQRTIIQAANPKLAFAMAAAILNAKPAVGPAIHPSAIIEPDAVIGANTRIGAGSVVGRNVRIGSDCVIYPLVVIYPDVEIGNNVVIHAGAVIGADGFGYVKDGERYLPFPQIGKVVIEDDVEIGANTCIDRGSLETTIIRRGTKIDNLVQIAHNVTVGEHTVIASQTGISGSSSVGAHSIVAGQVGIGEHARLDPHTILGGQAGVLNGKHVHGGEILWGTPARPLKEYLKQQASLARLPGWLGWLKQFKSKIGLGENSDS